MRRVLFIAYLFPPIANSGTRRSLSFVNHLPDQGWEPLVLTVADPAPRLCDPALLAEVRPGTRVERAPLGSTVAARRLARWLAPAGRREQLASGLDWRLAQWAQVPDEVAAWYPQAVRRGVELHRELGFDLVYASGWPWTSFLVARSIARRTGCPYVLDYRDLWRPTGTHLWEQQSRAQALFNPRLERWAARHASALVTVTPTLVQMIQGNADFERIHCITNGYEPADFAAPAEAGARPSSDDLVRVAYTGVWRPGYGLEDLYRAVQRLRQAGSPHLRRLRISAAGFKPGPAREFGVDDVVEELGPVPHERALELMRGADMLFLPVPEGFYATASLPGKLFEYLGSGRPILAAVPPASEVARVVEDVGGSLRIDPGDDTRLAQVLAELCEGRSQFAPLRPERLERYTRAATTRMLAQVFDAAQRGVPLEPLT